MKYFFIVFLFQFLFLSIKGQEKWTHVNLDSAGVKRVGILSESGQIIVPVEYDMIIGGKGFYFAKKQGLWGCYDSRGMKLVSTEYEDIGFGVSEELIRVRKNGKWGFVDFNARVVIDFKYDFACNFYKGEAYVMTGNSKFIINKTGMIMRLAEKEQRYCPEDGGPAVSVEDQFKDSVLAISQAGNKYGVIEIKTGKIVIPRDYDEIGRYFHNTILVRRGDKWGAFLDNGKLITEPKYSSIGIFWFN